MREEVAAATVAAWNRHWPVGTRCTLVDDLGRPSETVTRSEAWLVGPAMPVVKVEGIAGGYKLDRIIPHPPGVE
jgi:hypothetical protein